MTLKTLTRIPRRQHKILFPFAILLCQYSVTPLYSGQLCEKYWTEPLAGGEYILQNNVWGAETEQCIEQIGTVGFQITTSEHQRKIGQAPASYPSIYKGCHYGECTYASGFPVQVFNINEARFEWSFTPVRGGIWNAVAEAFINVGKTTGHPDGAELMLWFDSVGVAPAGEMVDVIQIDKEIWEVWVVHLEWTLITYRRRSPTNMVKLSLQPFFNDALERNYISKDWYIMGWQVGFEIWHGGVGLKSNTFRFEHEKVARWRNPRDD